jgi:hypothetical protein
MRRFVASFVALLCLGTPAISGAEEQKLVVVMPIDWRHARLNEADVSIVEEAVRSAAGNALSPLSYTVATQDTALQLLRDKGVDVGKLDEADSALAANRVIKTKLFITIGIATSGEKHSGQVRLFETSSGRIVSAVEIGGMSADGLKQSFRRKKEKLFEAVGAQEPVKETKVASTSSSTPANDDREPSSAKDARTESSRLKRLCDDGDGAACYERGRMYQTGEGFKRRDFETAERMYLAGCGLGVKDGCAAAKALAADNATAKKAAKSQCGDGVKHACSALK